MSSLEQRDRLSVQDYLQGELASESRHEYLGGEIYAMVGASDRHNMIAGNLFAALRPKVRGTPCQLFVADMKLRIVVAGDDYFYYPDLMLACDAEDRATYYRTRPCLIVEVLSRHTERTDRREKLLAYTRIDSLREYILISQDRQEITVHRREDDWYGTAVTQGVLSLRCVDVEIPLDVIYEDLPSPPTESRTAPIA